MTMNPNFQQVMMKPTKPERSRFIFIFFLCAVVSIYEVRSGNLLKFGSHAFFSYNSSSSASFLPLNSTFDDIRIFIGILTLPDQYQHRHVLCIIYSTQSPTGAKVDVKFVFCNLTKEDQKVLVALEIMRYDNIIILNCTENMNQGKTYTYFSSLPEMLNSTEGPSPPYHYVMKADDDTYLRLDNLVESLRSLL
ncbi:uncharacterized protein LOC117925340 [Vitis riparia]|uniref:uncharacterized protein LOC117925340 n=1 Tax=Vitis riparia TaxID=96939 RepID=UPI00155AFA9C|nr:uncharacterized protein LOC117925340 [Vitis riparia]